MVKARRRKTHIELKTSSAKVERIGRMDVTFLSPAEVTCLLDSSLFCESIFAIVLVFVR